MNMVEIKDFLARVEDSAGRDKALNDAFLEVGTALAEILAMLEKQGPDTAKAIAAALKGITVSMPKMDAPVVNVTVPEIKMPAINIPAPNVTVQMPEGKHKKLNLTITPNRAANGMATSYSITEA